MQKYSRRKLAQGFVELLDRHQQADVVAFFAQILAGHKLTHDLDLFANDVAHELLKRHRHLVASITTAREVPARTLKLVREALQALTDAVDVSVTQHINPALKGGMVVRTPVGELDTSIASKLNYLKSLR